ncbi:MAG: peptidoglycan editing factor PgeF [Cellvibrionaceae bacterium]|nr:peptidoglycan editing factor PgeF [Cellvibrionaceae bacterium]
MPGIRYLDWPAPARVKACYTLRAGGVSGPPFDGFNLAEHVGDNRQAVVDNRAMLSAAVGHHPIHWLQQLHGKTVVDLDQPYQAQADASTTRRAGQVCAVMTADCLPVFFCDTDTCQVAVAHAGWRGLRDGILQHTLRCFSRPQSVLAYLGPAISQAAFEVGDDVRQAFLQQSIGLSRHFRPSHRGARWMADLYGLARSLLAAEGLTQCYGGDRCTYAERDQFFSYRRDGQTGRMASLIWCVDGE